MMTEHLFPILELSGDSAEKDIWEITSAHIIDLGTFCRNVLLNHPGNQPKCKSQFCKKKKKSQDRRASSSLARRKTNLSSPAGSSGILSVYKTRRRKVGCSVTEIFGRGR